MSKGIPLTEEDLDQRRHQVFDASISLFLSNGFQETTMREIADAARMGKSTLYDYFKTKDEILISFVEDAIDDLTAQAQQIVARDLPVTERLHQLLHAHLAYLMSNKEIYIRLTYEVQRLALDSQQRIQARRHAYQDLICKLIEEAVAEGVFRPVDSLLATRTILALLTPVAYTSRPTGTPDEMLHMALDIFLFGVTAAAPAGGQRDERFLDFKQT
jgi:TetR/AcrR family transcriptional regulator, cholesterol catabolism regulator